MKFEPRQYQQDAVDAWWNCLESKQDSNPVIAVPTGAGKTVIMGMFIKKYIDKYPNNKVVVLSHTQDILEQDYDALCEFFPGTPIGLYSSGLGRKRICQITVAGIQSIYKLTDKFKWTNLYVIDECHTVNHKDTGMYRSLLSKHPGRKVGMSATVFRTGHGYIYERGALFDSLAYDLTSVDNFNELVYNGYLTKLISLSPEMEMDTEGIATSAGDYNVKQLGERFDRDSITENAVEELIKYGHNYKKWLVFAIDTDHADNICKELISNDVDADVLHSRMTKDRAEVTKRFKHGSTRALVSVGMVTTGFDAPNVDLIALLRPTKSAVLHVQMIGRGLRVAPDKTHCLVLDFAGNTERLGPINNVTIPKEKGKGKGQAIMKKCPECRCLHHASVRICDVCDHEFVFKTLLLDKPDVTPVVATTDKEPKEKWLTVERVSYDIHRKAGKPDSLLAVYHCGVTRIKEWVCCNHSGYAKNKAMVWLERRGLDKYSDTQEAFELSSKAKKPKKILVDFKDKYPIIKQSILE
jgi:DNA repair protein RadD